MQQDADPGVARGSGAGSGHRVRGRLLPQLPVFPVRIPDGANNLYILCDAGKNEKARKVEFKDLEVFRIK